MNKPDLIEFKLHGVRALVTGSASGIGLATAQRLARSGARVAMNDLPTDALAGAVGDLKAQGFWVEGVPGDLSESAGARDVALRSLEWLGDSTIWSITRARPARAHPYPRRTSMPDR